MTRNADRAFLARFLSHPLLAPAVPTCKVDLKRVALTLPKADDNTNYNIIAS